MPKKLLATIAVAVLVLGGFWGVQKFLEDQAHQEYIRSSDKIADDLVNTLKSHDGKAAYPLFTVNLQHAYSESYWTKEFFAQFAGYQGQPKRFSKKPANDVNQSQPKPYTAEVNAQQYQYDFQLHNLTYRVTFVVVSQGGRWQINELGGAYQP